MEEKKEAKVDVNSDKGGNDENFEAEAASLRKYIKNIYEVTYKKLAERLQNKEYSMRHYVMATANACDFTLFMALSVIEKVHPGGKKALMEYLSHTLKMFGYRLMDENDNIIVPRDIKKETYGKSVKAQHCSGGKNE